MRNRGKVKKQIKNKRRSETHSDPARSPAHFRIYWATFGQTTSKDRFSLIQRGRGQRNCGCSRLEVGEDRLGRPGREQGRASKQGGRRRH